MELDTKQLAAGAYRLRLTQIDQQSGELSVRIHPALPKISNIPLRLNLGEGVQSVRLQGTGLDRIERIDCPGMDWQLSPDDACSLERTATVHLRDNVRQGDRLQLLLTVRAMHAPVAVPGSVEIAGPRPRVVSTETSLARDVPVELKPQEIPAGHPVSFGIRAESLDVDLKIELACGAQERKPITLRPGETRSGARLDFAGEGILFLSLDRSSLASFDCDLTTAVCTESAGCSDPVRLGRVVVIPRIERLELTEERADAGRFVANLTGTNLQAIEKAGWRADRGNEVLGLPRPRAAESYAQTLRIALPWPAPSPRAPLYIWLRGETEGRATKVTF
jgi:hypothetical protein